jgi:hypothetical protein
VRPTVELAHNVLEHFGHEKTYVHKARINLSPPRQVNKYINYCNKWIKKLETATKNKADDQNPSSEEFLENARNRILDAQQALLKATRTQKTHYEKTNARLASTFRRPGLAAQVNESINYSKKSIFNKTSKRNTVGDMMGINPPQAGGPVEAIEAVNLDLFVGFPKSKNYGVTAIQKALEV